MKGHYNSADKKVDKCLVNGSVIKKLVNICWLVLAIDTLILLRKKQQLICMRKVNYGDKLKDKLLTL